MEYKGYRITVERLSGHELERIGRYKAAYRAIAMPIKDQVAHLRNGQNRQCSCLDSSYFQALATAGPQGDVSTASKAKGEAENRIKAGIDMHLRHRK